jgi:hypothetical protein
MPYREEDGGADRDRTDDILLAKQALYQLSYAPMSLALIRSVALRTFVSSVEKDSTPKT